MTSAIAAIAPDMNVISSQTLQSAQFASASASQGAGASAPSATASLSPTQTVSVSSLSASNPSATQGLTLRDTASGVFEDLKKADLEARPQPAQDALNGSEIEAARDGLMPSPWKVSMSGSIVPDQSKFQAEMNSQQALRKSFDHAIFITMVTQVVGGMSQTTNSLLRQP
ncbi:MAG: hypothetical protein AAGA88_00960 [Pseudomonadota bacterium]